MFSCEMHGVKDFEALAEPAAKAEAGHGGGATAFVASAMHSAFFVKSLSPSPFAARSLPTMTPQRPELPRLQGGTSHSPPPLCRQGQRPASCRTGRKGLGVARFRTIFADGHGEG